MLLAKETCSFRNARNNATLAGGFGAGMSAPQEVSRTDDRRHDLDALRAGAMLLGIALHASLSFFPVPWPVQDKRQHAWFGVFTAAIHGFRMPLFFLISGFFTMMLYRKRGMKSLLRQRATRILLPCVIGLVTVVPLGNRVSEWAIGSAARSARIEEESLVGAIRAGDRQAIQRFAENREETQRLDPQFGITPLGWAVLLGDVDTVSLLLTRGADVNQGNRDGSTPLHCAAFLGRHNIVEILLAHGANAKAQRHGGTGPAVHQCRRGSDRLYRPDPWTAALGHVRIGEQAWQGAAPVGEVVRSAAVPGGRSETSTGAVKANASPRTLSGIHQRGPFPSASGWYILPALPDEHLRSSLVPVVSLLVGGSLH